jgi:putative FmdB family regulatory protein
MSPIFQYKCNPCNYEFELFIGRNEIALCPNCKGPVKKLPTAASFRFGEQVRSPNSPDAVAEATEQRKQRRLKK